jgi:hypothetical protein
MWGLERMWEETSALLSGKKGESRGMRALLERETLLRCAPFTCCQKQGVWHTYTRVSTSMLIQCVFVTTGTGKTYTMLGADHTGTYYADMDANSEEDRADPLQTAAAERGIIPRAMDELFRGARSATAEEGGGGGGGGGEVVITASFIEIYNERVFDLLQPYKEQKFRDTHDVVQRKAGLQLREDGR